MRVVWHKQQYFSSDVTYYCCKTTTILHCQIGANAIIWNSHGSVCSEIMHHRCINDNPIYSFWVWYNAPPEMFKLVILWQIEEKLLTINILNQINITKNNLLKQLMMLCICNNQSTISPYLMMIRLVIKMLVSMRLMSLGTFSKDGMPEDHTSTN